MTTPPDALDLEELERLLGEATPGPWKANGDLVDLPKRNLKYPEGGVRFVGSLTFEHDLSPDAALIAALRNHGPALVRIARAALAFKRDSIDPPETCELCDALRAAGLLKEDERG